MREQQLPPKPRLPQPKLIYVNRYTSLLITNLTDIKIIKSKNAEGISIEIAKKNITINSENGVPVLEMTNDYGNSVRYEISDNSRFNSLWSQLWQFIKDNQH